MNTTHAVAGIRPHKRTATVAVVDVLGILVISLSFESRAPAAWGAR